MLWNVVKLGTSLSLYKYIYKFHNNLNIYSFYIIFRGSMMNAVEAAVNKANEMSKLFKA